MSSPLKSLEATAKIIRGLAADAVQKANSGHPGLPLGCAEIGASLYGHLLSHDPSQPLWPNRDRFVLSAGHGSMFLYSCLHLSGYDVSLDDLKNFRQWASKTPGHPEYGDTEGVEVTTGPLGQGVTNAVGMALASKIQQENFNTKEHPIIDHQILALTGDGCMMEGISYESCSLAGHLKLDNLTVIYDANDISLDAPTSVSFTEDVSKRFEGFGWNVVTIDGHDIEAFIKSYEEAKNQSDRPSLIIAKTTIGKGAPNKQGSEKAHGAPLGDDEIALMKKEIGLPDESFYVSDEVKEFMAAQKEKGAAKRKEWEKTFEAWKKANPEKATLWQQAQEGVLPANLEESLPDFETGKALASRVSSAQVLQCLGENIPYLIGGSADLSCSNNSNLNFSKHIQADDFSQRNIYFGVREHAMAAICNGMAVYGGILPFCATFLVFADYMRPSIRLAALMQLKVLFVFTHDSFNVGEDGPTHQPVETVASLRVIPGLTNYRPADANEVKYSYLDALGLKGPSTLSFSRQGLTTMGETADKAKEGVSRGAYILKEGSKPELDVMLLASGSEVGLCLEAAKVLEEKGKSTRVVSMPSFEKFDAQDKNYQEGVLNSETAVYWAVEAQVEFGWHKYIGREGQTICMTGFGASAPGAVLQEKFGFTVDQVVARVLGKEASAS
jgi:transketolase